MNLFEIEHLTHYHYESAACESFGHLRVSPKTTPTQELISHSIELDPATETGNYADYFGNSVEFFSVSQRHETLSVTSRSRVRVNSYKVADFVHEVTVAEARQLTASRRFEHYDFLRPTQLVPVGNKFVPYVSKYLPEGRSLVEGVLDLNQFIYERFQYQSGKTDVRTDALKVARTKRGVCQDFSHFMLGVLRTAQIPARYVSGYIETINPTTPSDLPDLIGSAASHAWVEVLLPGQTWFGLDPTNNLQVGDRHIVIATGRDYNDVPPLRGTYRGPKCQSMDVKVRVTRISKTT